MARGPRYRVPFQRRKHGKTDYKKRRALVLSGKPRLVARFSLRNVVAQIVVAKPYGDEVLVSTHSRELTKKYGWKAPDGNLPSAYLTGFLCGSKAKGMKEAILDVGLHSPTKGAKTFALLKGVVDAGIKIPHSEEKLPSEERIKGGHIAKYAESLASSNPEMYQSKFSRFLKSKLPPEELPKHFAKVKKEILAAFKGGEKKSETKS